MDAEECFRIRVLLLEDVNCCRLQSSSSLTFKKSTPKRKFLSLSKADMPIQVSINSKELMIGETPAGNFPVTVETSGQFIFQLNDNRYRGNLCIVPSEQGRSFDVINVVPLEPYLAGVIAAEMPDYWESAALEAQAIAARTYCLYIKKKFGSAREWDLRKTQANQAYHGVRVESTTVWKCVNATRGQVLTCRRPEGEYGIFPAYYSSACGGHTEDSKNVFGDSYPPLQGVPCPYCRDVARPDFFFWPPVKVQKASASKKLIQRYPALERLEKIIDIEPVGKTEYSDFSRITSVKLIGINGETDTLRFEDLRLTLDPSGMRIRSSVCRLVETSDFWVFTLGRGFGHGVGLCQCGAQQLAREGATAQDILDYYYPESRIENVYQEQDVY